MTVVESTGLDFPTLTREVQEMPTVQAGLIMILARVRNAIELAAQTDRPDPTYLRWLAGQLDVHAPLLADAVIEATPAAAGHEQRAAMVQREVDGE